MRLPTDNGWMIERVPFAPPPSRQEPIWAKDLVQGDIVVDRQLNRIFEGPEDPDADGAYPSPYRFIENRFLVQSLDKDTAPSDESTDVIVEDPVGWIWAILTDLADGSSVHQRFEPRTPLMVEREIIHEPGPTSTGNVELYSPEQGTEPTGSVGP